MDYRALAELVWMSLLGFSTVLLVLFVGARFALKPLLREFLQGRREQDEALTQARLQRLEGRVIDLEAEVERVRSTAEFDRRLVGEGDRGDGDT